MGGAPGIRDPGRAPRRAGQDRGTQCPLHSPPKSLEVRNVVTIWQLLEVTLTYNDSQTEVGSLKTLSRQVVMVTGL